MKQKTILCAALLLFVFSFFSCEKKKSIEAELPKEKTFRFFLTSEPPSLDWGKATDASSSMIIDNIMEGLLEYDFSKKEAAYKPALARSVTSKNNGQTWIFELREDAYWTDGVPFHGSHIIDGWERLLNPKTASEYAYFLFNVKNAREYNSGKIKDFSKVGISLTEDEKLKIELTGPKYFFPFTLTHTSTYPIRKDIIKKFGSRWTLHKNIVTLGPYTLHFWQQDKVVILKKNPSYYGVFPGNAENISLKIIPEISTALNLFDSGKLDLLDTLPSKQLSVLKKRPNYTSNPRLTTYYYGFQITKPPLNNKNLRMAIAMAIDKKQITSMLQGNATPLNSWIPDRVFGYDPSIGLSFNPKKARQILAKAGINPKDLPKITISYNTLDDHKRIAENIQAQLKKNLQLEVELMNEEWKVYLNSLPEGDMMIYRMGWVADYPDPDTFMTLMASYSDNNYTRWKNPLYDRLVEQASRLPNNEQRKQLYAKAQKILTEQDVPVIPIYFSKNSSLLSPRIKYYPDNIMRKYKFKEIIIH